MNDNAKGVKSIFLSAAERRSPEERAAYLAEACGGNAELRHRVETLLAAHDNPKELFGVPPPALAGTVDRSELAEGPGTVIDRYKLLQEIGEGGFGVVYMAEQQEPVMRKVALKIIKLGMDTRQVIARFESERQALAMMDHPNIAKVLDGGATETGRPYFAMELVRGIPVTEYCDKNDLTTNERLELFVDVCRAVQHAHQKGIIHRDIKPSNVIVTRLDGRPVPKVIDFGIAKATEHRLTEKTFYTDFHQFLGTPQYMSPEQAEMSGVDVDTRTDIYSLGVLLYELLIGSTPFDAKELHRAGYDEMCRIIRENDPPTPSRRLSTLGEAATTEVSSHRQTQPAALRRQLRGDLDWIVMKALEKDRNRRYETANDFAADVERYLTGEAVEARHPSAAYTFGKFARRNRTMLMTAALVAGALLTGTVASALLAVNATIERNKAEDARQREFAARRRAEDLRYASDMHLAEQALRDRDWWLVRRLLRAHHPSADGVDRRGWEWLYLWRACWDRHAVPTLGHKNWVNPIAISPDGATLVSGDMAGNLSVWDVANRKQLSSTQAHGNWVWDVEFSPDGKLVSCGGDNFIRLWSIDPGTRALVSEGALEGQKMIWRLALSNDGKLLASSGRAWKIRLWDLSTRETVAQIPGGAVALAFHPEGQALAAHLGNRVAVWRLPYDAHEPPWEIPGFDNTAMSGLAFSPDGRSIAASWKRNGVKLWSVADRKSLHHLDIPTRAYSLAFSPDGKTIAVGDQEKTVSIWSKTTGERSDQFSHSGSVCRVRFTRDGKTLASSSKDKTVRLWDLERNRPTEVLDHRSTGVDGLSFSPDGKWLATADFTWSLAAGQKVILWDPETWRKVKELPGHTLAFSRDNTFLAVGGETVDDGESVKAVHLWDLRARQVVHTVPRLRLLGFSPDGELALRDRQTLELWDASERKIVANYAVPESSAELWGAIMGSALSPDGRTLAISTFPGDVALLHARTLKILQHRQNALAWCGLFVVFSPDGDYLATPDGSHQLKVWDVRDGKLELIDVSLNHTAGVLCATFTPDGLLAAGCNNGTVTLWDTSTWTERATLKCHDRVLDAVCFSPDGSTMVTSGPDGTVRIHRAATPEEVTEAERTGVDPLSAD